VQAMVRDVVGALIDRFLPPGSVEEQWDLKGLKEMLHDEFGSEYEAYRARTARLIPGLY